MKKFYTKVLNFDEIRKKTREVSKYKIYDEVCKVSRFTMILFEFELCFERFEITDETIIFKLTCVFFQQSLFNFD